MSFAYNDALQLDAETNAFGVLVRAYDGLGRNAGFSLFNLFNPANHVNPVQSITYGYSALGRFTAVTSSVQSVSSVVNYSCLPNSDLISGWSNGILSNVKNYEAHRDLISAVENQSGASLISRFGYINDAIGRRTQRIDSGSATATNAFGYNPRSELTSAAMGTNAYGYAYDAIGNRLAVNNNAEALTYAANALNQYTNILRVSAPPREDLPLFDLDGNLTNDNAWAYAWDGENRLTGASDGSVTATYAYDYMSRRYRKIVGATTNTFQYDGWNLIQEVSVSGGNATTNVYSWGPDLSGSLQGAGGIGGLVSVTCDGATYYPCYDANGNITDYVGTNGTVVAHREYDAFGSTIVATGSMVHTLQFWFSTKYLDAETGLYYYGYRFYASEFGRWVSRDPLEEDGGLNIYLFIANSTFSYFDLLGAMAVSIPAPTIQYGTIKVMAGRFGFYSNGVSLSCTCVGEPNAKQKKLECKLTATPLVTLHPIKEFLDEGWVNWNGSIITTKQHELNHHKVFLNVYVPSFDNLVSSYEADECCNCSELQSELIEKFDKLRGALLNWENTEEYLTGPSQRQPALDYGTKKAVLPPKDKAKTPCIKAKKTTSE